LSDHEEVESTFFVNMSTPFVTVHNIAATSDTNQDISRSSESFDQHVQFGSTLMCKTSSTPALDEHERRSKFPIESRSNLTPQLVLNRAFSNNRVKEIVGSYCKRITEIEEEKNAQLTSSQSLLHSKQSRALRRGYAAAVNADWGNQSETEIREIKKVAASKRCVTTVQLTKNLLPYQKEAFLTFLDQRSQQIENDPAAYEDSTLQQEKSEEIRASIEKVFAIKESLFSKSDTEIESTEKADLQASLEISAIADALCMSLLNEDADSYIEQARGSLKEVDNRVNLTASWSQENRFSISVWGTRFKDALAKHQAELKLAETLSPETATSVVKEIVVNLEKEMLGLRAAITECDVSLKLAKLEDQTALNLNALGLQQPLSAAKSAEAIYSRMAEEYEVKLKNSPQLRAELLKLSSSIARDDSAETPQKTLLASLLSSLPLAQVTESSKKSDEISFLSQLDLQPEEKLGYFVIGTQEKIKLTPPSESISDEDRGHFTQGIHLIELALFRNFGMEGVRNFKMKFHDAIQAASPITLSKLQDFVKSENKSNSNSFYLSTQHGWSELQNQWEDPTNNGRVIQSEGVSFNPFSKELESITKTQNQEQSIQEGIQVTRKVLEDHLEELAPQVKSEILNRFDQRFVKNKMSLTLGSLKSLLQESEPQGYFNLSKAIINNLKWNLLKASVGAIQNTAWFLGSGPLPAFALEFAMEFYGDLTIRERMLDH
jgi:hypothetical protein